jgi:hypothetical protein
VVYKSIKGNLKKKKKMPFCPLTLDNFPAQVQTQALFLLSVDLNSDAIPLEKNLKKSLLSSCQAHPCAVGGRVASIEPKP